MGGGMAYGKSLHGVKELEVKGWERGMCGRSEMLELK